MRPEFDQQDRRIRCADEDTTSREGNLHGLARSWHIDTTAERETGCES
jgi:hypothetical protein